MLDIDRDRQRISLGLKQTQEDPWQRIVDTYNVGDELDGKVTKVVTFGAFVEILDGVEGLVHISELAPHHVESPREIVHPGDEIRVKILEIDSERRRLSLSAKRVEDQILPVARPGDADAAPRPRASPTAEAARAPSPRPPRSPRRPPRRLAARTSRLPRRRGRRGGAELPSEVAEAPEAEPADAEAPSARRRPPSRSPAAEEPAAEAAAEAQRRGRSRGGRRRGSRERDAAGRGRAAPERERRGRARAAAEPEQD